MSAPRRWPARRLASWTAVVTAASAVASASLVFAPLAAAAQAIPMGSTVEATVPSDEAATFEVRTPGAGFLTVVARSLDEGDLAITVTDGDGQAMVEGRSDQDHGGVLGDERVVVLIPEAGAYRVMVEALGFEASRVAVGASFVATDVVAGTADPDGRPSSAVALTVGQDRDDSLDPADPRDWYRIVPDAAGVLTVLVRAPVGDLVLEAYAEGAYAEPTTSSDQDQGGVHGNEAVTVDVTPGTAVLIRVITLGSPTERIDYRIQSGLVGG